MPFTGKNMSDLRQNIENGFYQMPKNLEIRPSCLNFINNCLQYDASKRYSWEELNNDPYVCGSALDLNVDDSLSFSLAQTGYYVMDNNGKKCE